MKLKTLALSLLFGIAAAPVYAEAQYLVRIPANVQVAAPEAPQTPTSYTSCLAYLNANPGASSGNYVLDPDGDGPIAESEYYCDMERHGGGWTLIVKGKSGSNAHSTADAVGNLIFPDQGDAAKLSDAIINTFPKTMYRVTNSTGAYSVFFDTSDTFSAVRQVSNKASLSIENPVWEGPFYDPSHRGLNTHQGGSGDFGRFDAIGFVYAGDGSCRLGIRVRAPGMPGDWCGPGDAATIWIR